MEEIDTGDRPMKVGHPLLGLVFSGSIDDEFNSGGNNDVPHRITPLMKVYDKSIVSQQQD